MGRDIVGYLVTEEEDTADPITVNVSIEKSDTPAGNTLILEYGSTKLLFNVKELLNAILDELLEV